MLAVVLRSAFRYLLQIKGFMRWAMCPSFVPFLAEYEFSPEALLPYQFFTSMKRGEGSEVYMKSLHISAFRACACSHEHMARSISYLVVHDWKN